MVLSLVGCEAVSDTLDADTTDYDRQLQIIADNLAMWKGDTEFIAVPIFYAVTDLDERTAGNHPILSPRDRVVYFHRVVGNQCR